MFPFVLIALLISSPLYGARLNQQAPAFTLTDSRQKSRTLQEFRGKIVVVNFWASWCAPCQAELPALNRLAADYKNQDVRVLAINVDTDKSAGQRTLARLGLNAAQFGVLWDKGSRVVDRYAIETMPSSYILDRRGVVRFIHAGFRSTDPPVWRKEIDSLR